jgi:rod shape determining protein RodA
MSRTDTLRQLPPNQFVTRRDTYLHKLHIDGVMLTLLLTLMATGLTVLYSASGADFDKMFNQAIRMLIGLTVMTVMAQIPTQTFQRWTFQGYVVGVLLLVATTTIGEHAKGAQRWLEIPGVGRFQPSEFMKLLVPLSVATLLARNALPPRWYSMLGATVLIMIPALLIAEQPDLGTALLIAASGFIVLFLAGLDWRLITAILLAIPPTSWLLWEMLHQYQRQRVLTFLDPESDPWGTGWNIMQSMTAIGSGGFDGKGWLNGTQSHLNFLPESSTDFAIAALAEEFGFTGVCALILLYLAIIARGTWIALQAQNSFDRLMAGTITFTFFLYVFVNMGMVSGILPVVGVPLPMISYGGTAMVTLLASFGILMSIHTRRKMLSR